MATGAGYDNIWIDLEHSSLSIDTACQLAATAHDLGLAAWVRIPERESAVIGGVLGRGAPGIIAPKLDTEAETRLLVRQSVGSGKRVAVVAEFGRHRSLTTK